MTRKLAEKILMNLQVYLIQEKWATQTMINKIFKAQLSLRKKTLKT
jgi:hypothetical protein